jgi:hypothetical protein
MKKLLLNTIALTLLNFGAMAQDVNIPDANFKAYLVGNTSINTNGDTEIQVTEANSFTGNIFGNNLNITNLTGIEAFTSLIGLYVKDNNLGSMDISTNTALTYIDCQNTNISTLDLSNNTALGGVTCSMNNLTSLDVSNNTALTAINCSNNDITSLDLSTNVLLSNFSCDNNNISSIDVSNNPDLLYFVCHFNNLTSIDISSCSALAHFSCAGNDITSLDVSNNLALGALYCGVTEISVLDLSANTSLQTLNCTSSNLSILNVANGNNVNFSLFAAGTNPNLTCIQVDDVNYSTTNWSSIDAGASFSLDCGYTYLINSISVQGEAGVSTITTQGGTLQMEATVLPANATDGTYTWSVANGTGSASIDATGVLTAITDGDVTVTATANDGSVITGDAVITITNQTVSIKEQNAIHNLTVYPNPVNTQLAISIDVNIEFIQLIDATGKTTGMLLTNGTIDVSNLANGVYFLKVQTTNHLVSTKFIKN